MKNIYSRGTNPTGAGNARDETLIDMFPCLYRFLRNLGFSAKYLISDVSYVLPTTWSSCMSRNMRLSPVFTLWFSSTIERKWRVVSSASSNAIWKRATPQHSPTGKKKCAPVINLSGRERGTNVQHRRTSTAHKLFGGMPSNNRSVATPTSQPICPSRHAQSTAFAKKTDRNIPRNVAGQALGAQRTSRGHVFCI